MSFTLKLRFTGTWVYVPSRNIHEDSNELDILAVETRGDPFPTPHWHYPFLIVEREHVTAENWKDNRIFGSPEPGNRWRAFLLDRKRLSLTAADPDKLSFRLPLGQVEEMPECPADATEEQDFRWLAQMGRLHPGQGRVDPDVLQHPQSHPRRIAAAVHLSEGDFRTLFVSRDAEGELIQWELRGGGPPVKQPLAEMMEYRMDAGEGHVWLKYELWDEPATAAVENAIQLTPKTGETEVVAYVKVVMLDHLWKIEPRRSRRETIHHFGLLNRPFPGQLPLQAPEPDGSCGNFDPSDVQVAPLLTDEDAAKRGFPPRPRRFNDPQCPGLAADP